MKKNVASQKIGAQMVSATDGSAFTGSVTVYVCGDAGTQAAGSVGSGACTHEGNGYHTYAPAQAETNYDLVAFTFTGTGAVPATVQVYTTYPQTGDAYLVVSDGTYGNSALKTLIDAVDNYVDTEIGALTTELAKVPKSDSTVSWNATALAAINAEVDTALNTAIPGSPVANSINERIATMDGLLLGTIAAGTHNPQSGDAYAIVNSGTYGNNALKTLIDTVDNFVDTEIGTLVTELAKVPKSDSNVTWNSTALASIQSEATDALNAYDPPTKAEMDSAFATTDGYVDTELAAISSTLTTMDGKVDDILLDTGTTIPATLTTPGSTVWNTLLTALTTTGSIGKALADWLVARVPGSTAFTASDVAVCNNALLLLGNNAITALTDDTKAAKLCLQFYQQTVDAVLRAYTWNCATVRSADLTATTAPAFGFSYAFTLPADCLRVLMIEDDETIKFKIEGSAILTDESTCKISYIKRITPDDADGLLIETISARLAATIAFSLTNSVSATEAMWKLYKDKLDEAQTIDAFEGTAPQMASDDWINSRS